MALRAYLVYRLGKLLVLNLHPFGRLCVILNKGFNFLGCEKLAYCQICNGVSIMGSNKLACPACSSRGVRPSTQWSPLDGFYRVFGRTPHNCLWCGKRSYLVAQGKGDREELAEEMLARDA